MMLQKPLKNKLVVANFLVIFTMSCEKETTELPQETVDMVDSQDGPISEEEAVKLALAKLDGKVELPDPNRRTVVVNDDNYVITWLLLPAPSLRAQGDFAARATVDRRTGEVKQLLAGS